jgi:hypothetical protein
MSSRSFGSLLVLLPVALAAQSLLERAVPLNNWSAPPHVRRSQMQTQQRATPKLQIGGGVAPDLLVFVPIAPCRLADTRVGSGYPALGTTPLASLTPRNLLIAGACGIPTGGIAEAYSLNVTVVPPGGGAGGYLLVYPNPATPIPLVASLTWSPGAAYQTNAVITASSSDGSVNVVANSTTDVVVDTNGYYAAPTDAGGDTGLGKGALASDVPELTLGLDGLQFIGYYNTAFGSGALGANSSGNDNTAVGYKALAANISGGSNTALGQNAGVNITGSGNIMIGSEGTSSDSETIRIGDVQTSAYMAGIFGHALSGASAVVVNASGQLGVESVSSRRYKEDVQDMGDTSEGLLRLRPVTFHYKQPDPNGSKPLEYGLIAEEVADVYPELVVRGAGGQIESVQYLKLPALLLNELQKQYRHVQEQDRSLEQQARRAEQQNRRAQQQDEMIKKLEARLAALETQLTNATGKATTEGLLPSTRGGH